MGLLISARFGAIGGWPCRELIRLSSCSGPHDEEGHAAGNGGFKGVELAP